MKKMAIINRKEGKIDEIKKIRQKPSLVTIKRKEGAKAAKLAKLRTQRSALMKQRRIMSLITCTLILITGICVQITFPTRKNISLQLQ